MTDKELIRFCAQAMGYRLGIGPDDQVYIEDFKLQGFPTSGQYNPLEDDDALELVKEFGLSIDAPIANKNSNWFVMGPEGFNCFSVNLNRAIVEWVANMHQRNMQKSLDASNPGLISLDY